MYPQQSPASCARCRDVVPRAVVSALGTPFVLERLFDETDTKTMDAEVRFGVHS